MQVSIIDQLTEVLGGGAKSAIVNKPARRIKSDNALVDIGKFLRKVGKLDASVWEDKHGQQYTFTTASREYAKIISIAKGKRKNPIEDGHTARELATDLVASALYNAYKLDYITDDQINEQYRIEDEMMYTAQGRLNVTREAKRDILWELIETHICY